MKSTLEYTAFDDVPGPLNGLASTSEIIDRQLDIYGISVNDTTGQFDDATDQASVPTTGTTTATAAPSTASTSGSDPYTLYAYDGPVDTGKSFGDMLKSYGFPSDLSGFVRDAEDAIVGIPDEIQQGTPLAVILSKPGRLQGIGAAFILIGIILIVLHALA